MATTHWRKGYSVTQLYAQPDAGWSFHQLAHLLLGMEVEEEAVLDTLAQRVAFTGSLSRSLPPGEIRRVVLANDGLESEAPENQAQPTKPAKIKSKYQGENNKHVVECAHYNLTGLDGPLAEPFSDMMREDEYYGEGAMAAFVDVFNNRIHALRYLVHAQTNYTLTNSRASENGIGEFLLALSGHYYATQRALHGQQDDTLLALSGQLANCRMTLPTIRQLFDTVLSLPVIAMNSLIGRWLTVQDSDHTRLGCANHRLGQEATLGKRIWDQQAMIELELGPIDSQRASELVPGGVCHHQLRDLLAWISERRVDCRVSLVCQPDDDAQKNATTLSSASGLSNRLGYGAALMAATQRVQPIRFLLEMVA
ncbi:type VI secretion system baseplate subunit TssG [Marinomonas transparens]|uniref:Type VI secretion system baseplate subunit TssG n=1 Tax=Marinomonas transparens TaxID=2795388 RepID=A0A934JX53_9GAMM|nr:type VI secretion system baseplate subunit TssG [Marinomonas transparens]MBJ7540006.1 type VI secretion system baseplate subunit TssG [Marinomonas transparens]